MEELDLSDFDSEAVISVNIATPVKVSRVLPLNVRFRSVSRARGEFREAFTPDGRYWGEARTDEGAALRLMASVLKVELD